MEIEMISCDKVKPCTPTPPHSQCYKLSMLDQILSPVLVNAIFFYPASSGDTTTSADDDHTRKTDQLKLSLAQTLTRFYPVAGRGSGDNESILCSDEGVPFTVAKVRGGLRLSDFLENHGAGEPTTLALVPCPVGLTVEWGLESPVARIQVTHFACGGLALGVVFWHKVVDGVTVANFMKYWAAASSGAERPAVPDYNIARSLFTSKTELRDSILSMRDHCRKVDNKYFVRRYVFDVLAIKKLKMEASNVVDSPTRVEVITALLWKCYMIASLANGKQASSISHAVNLRRTAPRHDPHIPATSFGNLIAVTAGSCTNVPTTSFGNLVKETRDMIRKIDNEYVKRMCGDEGLSGYHENMKQRFSGMGEAARDCLFFTSWCGMGFYDLDFGWGKPLWMRNCNLTDSVSSFINLACLNDTNLGDGSVEACLLMEQRYVHIFDNIRLLQGYRSSTTIC